MPVPEDSNLDYKLVTQIAILGGHLIKCRKGSYREYIPGLGKTEVFECIDGEYTDSPKVVGRSDSVIAMWFSQELDN